MLCCSFSSFQILLGRRIATTTSCFFCSSFVIIIKKDCKISEDSEGAKAKAILISIVFERFMTIQSIINERADKYVHLYGPMMKKKKANEYNKSGSLW
jgi:hypothetical protein